MIWDKHSNIFQQSRSQLDMQTCFRLSYSALCWYTYILKVTNSAIIHHALFNTTENRTVYNSVNHVLYIYLDMINSKILN